ncbi:glycerol-3-phosphate dehydrogenase/oxidase [Subsaximicrobium wynnwilliamsii]|uniref:Glycerol-3-phosphate dehydrogenase/oxidase n=1 Tax=Subsaximicrobium wynnwilliamsii TaxID=291179 RepID=A0A5C6ZPB2_9FLAO|nr:glycerol-3-phosphate dehydrogenase/oxidase [Subsaximicrobium wynnwilliamsii]TXD91257.1 glycerol-3-phosphate dehydrogenase/oxidase [Subsaximicrobium wynnwilliamsii]TXE04650.1 glycerol-3-phosphate dehydrogenase/oxidase [Subsaximicrobium wynnwilliamsii]
MKMDRFKRETLIAQMKTNETWDAIIVGGGATGLGIALDCATRGYKTLLLEQVDFAKGTSSRSTKLVHGGVRYLAQGNIDLVREALHERGLMMKNAAHLVSNQSFIIPNYSWWDHFFYTVGLKVYDFLSGNLSFGKSTRIGKKETMARLPTIETAHLRGGVVYQDGQFDDSRLAVNIAQTAIEQGATLLNHFEVKQLLKNDAGIVNGVVAVDQETNETYQLKSKVVINATGVFTDEVLQMDNPSAKDQIKPSQGIHLVLDKSFLAGNDAIMIPKTDDGRVLFLVPWHNRVVVGTTDTVLDSHSLEPRALEAEINFILTTANRYLNKDVSRDDVLSMYAGLRPLAAPKDDSEKTKEISRSHKIIVSDSELITITGGKWTTYRKMAEDTVNRAIKMNKLPQKECRTKDLLIHGSSKPIAESNHLYVYGSDIMGIEALQQEHPELKERLHERVPFTKAEVVWAVRHEMARTIDDVLARRVRVLFLDAGAAIAMAPEVAALIAKELGRDKQWEAEQVKDFLKIADHFVCK